MDDVTAPGSSVHPRHLPVARTRVLIAGSLGLVCFVVTLLLAPWQVAVLAAWNLTAVFIVSWVLTLVLRKDGNATAHLATREDNSRAAADLLLVSASLASLAGVAFGLVKAASETGMAEASITGLAVLSVVLSWLLVQVTFMLRYARLYYAPVKGGIDFNEDEDPDYRDFAYLAFTIGMTYQVSDTNLTAKAIRRAATRHALLSFVFGTTIIAVTINVVAGLLNR
jgi:uncharacterized membrane protein